MGGGGQVCSVDEQLPDLPADTDSREKFLAAIRPYSEVLLAVSTHLGG